MSADSQFTEEEGCDDLSFLEACTECDDDTLYEIIQNGVTWEQVNETDKSGRTGLSHACANGFMPILELLADVEDVDPNLPDNDGNTSLIFAAQAGHDDVVNFMLRHFRNIRIDASNKLGFTALLKAAIQGRTRCAKLLLFAGANPNRRDCGRGFCAEEWARFCGCHQCADAVAKYIRSKKYFFKKTFLLSKEKWNSEPDLTYGSTKARQSSGGNWIQRHLSLRRKKGGTKHDQKADNSVAATSRCGSAPLLITISPPSSPPSTTKNYRRPSCVDGVVACSIVSHSKLRMTSSLASRSRQPIIEETTETPTPPKITVEQDDKT